jgi:hypothetical protein
MLFLHDTTTCYSFMVFVLLVPAQQMLVKIAKGHFEEKKNTISNTEET